MMHSRVMASGSPGLPVKPTVSIPLKSDEPAFRATQTPIAFKLPSDVKPETAVGQKPVFSHPKSAPIRPVDADSDGKKQHFMFLGNLMAAPESREAVIAKQKQYFEELSRQVMEKKRVKETSESLTSSNRLSAELQTINEELRMERNQQQLPTASAESPQIYTRFRKKADTEILNLHVSGNSFCGGVLQRDEVALMRKKKEEQQRDMQEALRRQIDEKARKKQEEREARLQEEVQHEKSIFEAQRKMKEDFDRENGILPKPPQTAVAQAVATQPPETPINPPMEMFATMSTITRQTSVVESPREDSIMHKVELEKLNAKVEEMQRSNQELMDKLKEQNQMILQIQDQKPSRATNSIPRPKPPPRAGPHKDVRKIEEQKRKERHEEENARIRAYELKIENARRKKEAQTHAPRGRQTSGLLRQSTYDTPERPTPLAVPRMQSAFASGLYPLQPHEEVPVSASKMMSSRPFFSSGDGSPMRTSQEFVDTRQNLDTAGKSEFIYPKADGTFYPAGQDELDKLIESENQKLRRSPSIPEMGGSQWAAVPKLDALGHQSQMSYMTNPDVDLSASKVSRFPRDVFGSLSRKRP